MIDIIEKARVFATAAHAAAAQLRKYTNEPYIVHPTEVASIVDNVEGSTHEMVAAAWLHDVVEDTGVTIEVIRAEFGEKVAELVGWLTDVDAVELVRLLQHALEQRMNVVVHCHAGVCRSGAVCEVGVMMGFRDTEAFRSPNLLVKHKMMKELGWNQ